MTATANGGGSGTGGLDRPGWTFLTNHGHVLLAVARSPDARVQDLAATVGISSRAVMTILQDLEAAGYVHRDRRGRRNHYTVEPDRPFRHPASAGHTVGELIDLFAELTASTHHT